MLPEQAINFVVNFNNLEFLNDLARWDIVNWSSTASSSTLINCSFSELRSCNRSSSYTGLTWKVTAKVRRERKTSPWSSSSPELRNVSSTHTANATIYAAKLYHHGVVSPPSIHHITHYAICHKVREHFSNYPNVKIHHRIVRSRKWETLQKQMPQRTGFLLRLAEMYDVRYQVFIFTTEEQSRRRPKW